MVKQKGFISAAIVALIAVGTIIYVHYSFRKKENFSPKENLVNVSSEQGRKQLKENRIEKNNETQEKKENKIKSNERKSNDLCQTPFIQILSPRSGDRYHVGDWITIRWSACGDNRMFLSLKSGGHDLGLITENPVPVNNAYYRWYIERIPVQGVRNYSIVFQFENRNLSKESGIFSILPHNENNVQNSLEKTSISSQAQRQIAWTSYESQNLGVSFLYPSQWDIIQNNVVSRGRNNEILSIETFVQNPSHSHISFSVHHFFHAGQSMIDFACQQNLCLRIRLDGKNAFLKKEIISRDGRGKLLPERIERKKIYIPDENEGVFEIIFDTPVGSQEYEQIFREFLRNFHFLS